VFGWRRRRRFKKSTPALNLTETASIPLADFPTGPALDRCLQNFPPAFRRAFTLTPLDDDELLVGRDSARATLEDCLARWRAGATPLVAVVGDLGAGKTSLLHWLERQRRSTETVHRLAPDQRVRSATALCEQLAQLTNAPADCRQPGDLAAHLAALPGHILLADNIQALFLRTMGFAGAVRVFLEIALTGSQRGCLWVFSITEPAWRRLDYTFQIGRHCTDVIRLPDCSAEELTRILQNRLTASGLALAVSTDGAEGSNETRQTAVLERCARELTTLAEGNLTAALYFWLHRVQYRQGAVQIGPLQKPDLSPLQTLEHAQQYTLAETLANGGLSVTEHAAIFQCDPLESGLILAQLVREGLLHHPAPGPEETRYRINPIAYYAVLQALNNSHILY